MFCNDIEIVIPNTKTEKLIFACDFLFYKKFARYLLKSCDDANYNVHFHLVGNNDDNKHEILDFLHTLSIDCSFTCESKDDTLLEYPLYTYYYTARYFVTKFLFENTPLQAALLTDADVIVERKFNIPQEATIGAIYSPKKDKLFTQIQGNLFFIKKEKGWFIDKLIDEYYHRFYSTDWAEIQTSHHQKYVQLYTGLDQICIASIIQLVNEDPTFINLKSLKLISGVEGHRSFWTLTGKGQKENMETFARLNLRFNL